MDQKKTKLMLYSTLVEVEVGVELGNNPPNNEMKQIISNTFFHFVKQCTSHSILYAVIAMYAMGVPAESTAKIHVI